MSIWPCLASTQTPELITWLRKFVGTISAFFLRPRRHELMRRNKISWRKTRGDFAWQSESTCIRAMSKLPLRSRDERGSVYIGEFTLAYIIAYITAPVIVNYTNDRSIDRSGTHAAISSKEGNNRGFREQTCTRRYCVRQAINLVGKSGITDCDCEWGVDSLQND